MVRSTSGAIEWTTVGQLHSQRCSKILGWQHLAYFRRHRRTDHLLIQMSLLVNTRTTVMTLRCIFSLPSNGILCNGRLQILLTKDAMKFRRLIWFNQPAVCTQLVRVIVCFERWASSVSLQTFHESAQLINVWRNRLPIPISKGTQIKLLEKTIKMNGNWIDDW